MIKTRFIQNLSVCFWLEAFNGGRKRFSTNGVGANGYHYKEKKLLPLPDIILKNYLEIDHRPKHNKRLK